jgi:hypothetical protein
MAERKSVATGDEGGWEAGHVRPCMKLHTRDGEADRDPTGERRGAISDDEVNCTLSTISFPLGIDGEWL